MKLNVNGETHDIDVEPEMPLLSVQLPLPAVLHSVLFSSANPLIIRCLTTWLKVKLR